MAAIFPGQGCQFIGMLSDLFDKNLIIQKIFKKASDILKYDLWKLIQKGPLKKLNTTYYSQPAILIASFAIYKLWIQKSNIIPNIMVGHSLGEYTAMLCSNVINFYDAIQLINYRGKLMQEISVSLKESNIDGYFMQVILGLNKFLIQKVCEQESKNNIVNISSYNTYNQVTISGNKNAILRVINACKLLGAHNIPLQINVPSHCLLMKPIVKKFKKFLKNIKFNYPTIPIINTLNIKCETSPKKIKYNLIHQLYNPINWIGCMEYISNKNINNILEFGPKNILAKIAKNITNNLDVISINNSKTLSIALKKYNNLRIK
ncbi:ACP S-malonyltransferase [Enterobacteriaceae endosymbiont of Plateumaris braccata]|uniref:ACP S-malonyltransferase n=1 Tax=Enterobacteriaceae endosymbiont of Plateumaris braccata TaxID=2675793 RepID=UPI001448F51E|nr:ACP S-malonyltransferase [Enterobacteriaceae endosymbiont of Plateumaris braccata]QJC28049.1 ACP S-malonyltransferase [Enterobacteriaceae endosymbiont of Plateumaris braccata]